MLVGAPSTRRRAFPAVLPALLTALTVLTLIGGCTTTVTGHPLAVIDPEDAGGLPVRDGPSGPREGVADAELPVDEADGGETDILATNAVADVQAYWTERFPTDFQTEFEPIERLVSYDSTASKGVVICGADTSGIANAFYCPPEDTIAWDRGHLLPVFIEALGPMSAVLVLAHEMGHAVQSRLGLVDGSTPTIVAEQQADCFSGAFMRHVAEGSAEHFELATGDGLNNVLAALVAIRDQVGASFAGQGAHGTAFDRVISFQFGWTDGPARCAEIDKDEIARRVTELEFDNPRDQASQGNMEINQDNIDLVVESLHKTFADTGAGQPSVSYDGADCGGSSTPAVAFCAGDNRVAVDLDALTELAAPRNEQLDTTVTGDFTALGVLASRYVLSVQQELGFGIDGSTAALRTACLVGTWAGLHLKTPFGNRNRVDSGIVLSPGDLDEAVSELLSESLIASDATGNAAMSGFARVEAFQVGFLQGAQQCAEQFP